MTARDGGFTLIELLAAVAVLGLIMAGLSNGIAFGTRAWDAQQRIIAARADLDAVDRALRGLIARIDPGALPLAGTAERLDCATDLPEGVADPALRHADIALFLDAAHRLALRWTPHRNSRTLAPPPLPAEMVLLSGVAALRFAYLGDEDGAWRDTWTDPAPPRLVRIRLGFPAGDPRSWPDIVARPMQGHADE